MPDYVSAFGVEMANGILEEAATGQTKTSGPSEIARAVRLHAGLGALAERIKGFDARKAENDPGPITIRARALSAHRPRLAGSKSESSVSFDCGARR
jgi:hypothetical protein